MEFVTSHLALLIGAVVLVLALALHRLVLRLFGMVVIPEDAIGIVTKKFVLFGTHKALPDGAVVALQGEAGVQADTLAPGVHFGLWPWQFDIEVQKFVTIERGKLGVVTSRDGRAISGGRILGRTVECDTFQNARAFLTGNGERGPQLAIIPPGTYRINTGLFEVNTCDCTEIKDNMVGVVTTKEGTPLDTGDIAGGEIGGHNMYQNPQTFIDGGGRKGLQEQVILAGRYFINPLFATVEEVAMTEVPIAHAGVVIAFVGKPGVDVTGDAFKHGNLVSKGEKGVWAEPLDPGRYPINPYTHKVEAVPTANVVLNWATGKTEAHMLDKNLSTITVRSSDGFTFNLDVSQIIHIPRNDAPKVIARFGNVANLVTQVLEPTIGNYFRNAAQGSDVIKFLSERQKRQDDAKKAISGALTEYNVNAVDTLIGDITPPKELMKTLTDRKIAEQEQMTFDTQRMAEDKRKDLEQAKATAATQAKVVDAERKVAIAEFEAQQAVKKAEGDSRAMIINAEAGAKMAVVQAGAQAESKTLQAQADAKVLTMVGEAEGKKITAVGNAEAEVIRLKANAVDQSNYATIEVARALANGKHPLVPQIVAGGDGGGGGGMNNLTSVLLANLITGENHNGKTNGSTVARKPSEKSSD
jgi:uncharacterized membrane protein YqiK